MPSRNSTRYRTSRGSRHVGALGSSGSPQSSLNYGVRSGPRTMRGAGSPLGISSSSPSYSSPAYSSSNHNRYSSTAARTAIRPRAALSSSYSPSSYNPIRNSSTATSNHPRSSLGTRHSSPYNNSGSLGVRSTARPRSALNSPSPPAGSPIGSPRSSPGVDPNHVLTVHLWGEGEPVPAHWGTMTSRRGETSGNLYHVEQPLNWKFDTRTDFPLVTSSSRGHSEVAYLTRSQRQDTERLLTEFGRDERNLPPPRACQDYTARSLGHLEQRGLVPPETASFWRSQRGYTSRRVAQNLQEAGRSWIPAPPRPSPPPGGPDVRRMDPYAPRAERNSQPGRINMANYRHLSGRR